jgi:hypothetical protein
VAQQHRQQLADIEPIGLGPALTPIDLNTGRINDVVLDTMRDQAAMQPKSVAARLVAAYDACVRGQAKALLRLGDLLLYPYDIPSRDRPFAWRLCYANGEAELPSILPQFKRQRQRGLGERVLLNTAHCGCCHRLTPS